MRLNLIQGYILDMRDIFEKKKMMVILCRIVEKKETIFNIKI